MLAALPSHYLWADTCEADIIISGDDSSKASCSHTAIGDKDPWWKLDLGSPKLVTKVQVWNRVGCCSNRLSGVKISVDGAVCGALSGATSVQTVACNKKGQDVKFSMPRAGDYLTLCE